MAKDKADHDHKMKLLDDEIRELRLKHIEAHRSERQKAASLNKLGLEVANEVRHLTAFAMTIAGFSQHKREWRRMKRSTRPKVLVQADVPNEASELPLPTADVTTDDNESSQSDIELFISVIQKSLTSGDPENIKHCKLVLGEMAESDLGQRILSILGMNLGDKIRDILITEIVGADVLAIAFMESKFTSILNQLAGTTPSLIERLLAERAALGWLDVHQADLAAIEAKQNPLNTPSERATLVCLEKRRSLAQRRYVAAPCCCCCCWSACS